MASSKSLASTGSMVNVRTSRMSFLFLISAEDITSGRRKASSITSSSNTSGKPFSTRISFIAISLSSPSCKTCTTSPSGFLLVVSHLVILANTLSLSCAPFNLFNGIKRSGIPFCPSAMKKAKFALTCT